MPEWSLSFLSPNSMPRSNENNVTGRCILTKETLLGLSGLDNYRHYCICVIVPLLDTVPSYMSYSPFVLVGRRINGETGDKLDYFSLSARVLILTRITTLQVDDCLPLSLSITHHYLT